MAELRGRFAVQDDEAVGPPGDRAALGERGQGAGHGRALGGDEARHELVGQVHRDDAPVAGALAVVIAPALGDVPEQDEQADVHADELADREVEQQRPRAGDRAAEERRDEVGPAADDRGEAAVEDGEPRGLDDVPPRARDERLGVVGLPRVQQVARTEELGRRPVDHADVAQEEPVEDQQTEAAGGLVAVLAHRVPLAGLEPVGVGERVDGRVVAGRLRDRGRQAGVGLKDLDPVAGFGRWA